MDTRREGVAETAENPAALADAESNARQMIAGFRERMAARARAAGTAPLGAAAAAVLALLAGWMVMRRRGRR